MNLYNHDLNMQFCIDSTTLQNLHTKIAINFSQNIIISIVSEILSDKTWEKVGNYSKEETNNKNYTKKYGS